jgi:hypothetical protein
MFEKYKAQWVGKRVISISNGFQADPDDPSLKIGVIQNIVPISLSQQPIPVVQFEGSEEAYACFSTLLEYSDDLWRILNLLNAQERWELIQAFSQRLTFRE